MTTAPYITESITTSNVVNDNNLFPVFLKLEHLSLLIIGGGNVALEKLNAVMKNSPQAQIKLVAIHISDSIKKLAGETNNIELFERPYTIDDFNDIDIVIAAVNSIAVSEQIQSDAKQKGKLINVADKPSLCDFYLGSIVKKEV